MIDIEALGKTPGSAIIEIGAVIFDLFTDAEGAIAYETVSEFRVDVAAGPPFTADFATLEWHKARGSWPRDPKILQLTPATALAAFQEWLAMPGHEEVAMFWSWGKDYDFPILDRAFQLARPGESPWFYWEPKDARDMWALAYPGEKHPPRPHQALQDCRAAIVDLVDALNRLRVAGPVRAVCGDPAGETLQQTQSA